MKKELPATTIRGKLWKIQWANYKCAEWSIIKSLKSVKWGALLRAPSG
jgi:hypothetical protein